MKLSIGVPAYNQGPYLRQCVESLLNQTSSPHEIVVSDNHSTDETGAILENFKESVRVIRPPRHLSMVAHWNFLANHLRGDWFSLLSSDDTAKPNFVATLSKGAARSAHAVLVRAASEWIDKEGKVVRKRRMHWVGKVISPPETLHRELASPRSSFAGFAVNRHAFEKAGGFPEECGLAADWGLWIRLSALGNFVREPGVISQYRYSYRPELDRKRKIAFAKADAAIFEILVPKVAGVVEGADLRKILRASRKRCHKRLCGLSQILATEERELVAEALSSWARNSGCNRDFERFCAGEVFFHKSAAYAISSAIARLRKSLDLPRGKPSS